jgi:hypothetical protein
MAKAEDTKENLEKCHCPKCPTLNDCGRGKGEALFCVHGLTDCGFSRNGCICGGCLVRRDNHLKGFYYCLNGSAENE